MEIITRESIPRVLLLVTQEISHSSMHCIHMHACQSFPLSHPQAAKLCAQHSMLKAESADIFTRVEGTSPSPTPGQLRPLDNEITTTSYIR